MSSKKKNKATWWLIVARFDGTCDTCETEIAVGDTLVYCHERKSARRCIACAEAEKIDPVPSVAVKALVTT